MGRNLAKLNAKLRSLSGGKSVGKRKAVRRLKKKMQRARCGQTYASLKTIAGADPVKKRKSKPKKVVKRVKSAEEILKATNTFKTMCVRSCDGYFFPVSFSTTKDAFRKDAQACDALCPGAEMRLYFHSTKGGTAENMISMKTGEPYTKLPRAFSYQKSFNQACTCNHKLVKREPFKRKKEKARRYVKAEKMADIGRIALPAFRVDQGQDPETLLTEQGGFTLEQAKKMETGSDDGAQKVARRVRVIGEEFFPAQ